METFVVRVFVASDGAPADLSGIVQHVASGHTTPFRGEADLLQLLRLSHPPPATSLREGSQQDRGA